MQRQTKRTSQSPVKVYERTKTQIRFAASIQDRPQAEVMEAAMDEYIERHVEDFALGLKHASEALLGGTVQTLAYVMKEDSEVVRSVIGEVDPDLFKPRKAVLPRTSSASS